MIDVLAFIGSTTLAALVGVVVGRRLAKGRHLKRNQR